MPKMAKLSHYVAPKVVPKFLSISKTLQVTELKSASSDGAADEYDAFYEELKPLWIMLRMVGCLPIHKPDRGETKFRFLSRPMLYAFCYLAVIVALNTIVTIVYLGDKQDKSHQSMADFIFWCLGLGVGVQPIVITLSHWWKAKEVSNLMNGWMAFQNRYHLVTRNRLHLRLRRATTLLVVGVTAFAFIVVGIFNEWSSTGKSISSFYRGYSFLILILHLVSWCLLCEATKRAATAFMASLNKDFVSSGRSTAQLVHEYRCLWLQLSRLTRDIGNAFCYAFGFIVTFWVVNVLFSMYVLLVSVFHKTEENTWSVFIYWTAVSLSIGLFCNYASWTTVAVGDHIKNGLTELRTPDKDTNQQLHHFDLTISSNEPTISLGGYVTVNRELLMSVYETVVTYMVVLLQYNAE